MSHQKFQVIQNNLKKGTRSEIAQSIYRLVEVGNKSLFAAALIHNMAWTDAFELYREESRRLLMEREKKAFRRGVLSSTPPSWPGSLRRAA